MLFVAKTKALISYAVTAQLICVFIFAYAKSRFSLNEAHISNKKAMNRNWGNQKANSALKTKTGNKQILQIDKIQWRTNC